MFLLGLFLWTASYPMVHPSSVWAAEGELTLRVIDEATGDPIAARVELTRPELMSPNAAVRARVSRRNSLRVVRPLPARGTVATSFGFVLEGDVKLNLKEGPYEFRVTHGPEYRVIRGNFTIEKTSEDEHVVSLPRIMDMSSLGWTSVDCFVPPSRADLGRRMRSEELNVAWTSEGAFMQTQTQPPIRDSVLAKPSAGLLFYSRDDVSGTDAHNQVDAVDPELAALARLASIAKESSDQVQVAIENPFAWPLPVYLASRQIDGTFVLGDWLRLDKRVSRASSGRAFPMNQAPKKQERDAISRDAVSMGREVEQIYWEMLNAGLRMPPIAGTGDESPEHPVGYNRLYVSRLSDSDGLKNVWDAVWNGNSFATNGPLLQPRLDGQAPGHVFRLTEGAKLSLTPEVTLTVRDPVEYLEVIVNGMVHYTAKLDEFAKARGRISPIAVNRPGWALIRIVTLHEGHFRAAMSAPWYFEVDGERRVSRRSVEFFQEWLADYERELTSRPDVALASYAPFIRAARQFWQGRFGEANTR